MCCSEEIIRLFVTFYNNIAVILLNQIVLFFLFKNRKNLEKTIVVNWPVVAVAQVLEQVAY